MKMSLTCLGACVAVFLFVLFCTVCDGGLVLSYDFNTNGNQIVRDTSGHGNDGIITNATYVELNGGGAYEFDGTNSYIRIPQSSSLTATGSMTLALRMKVYNYDRERALIEWYGTESGLHLWTGVWGWQWGGLGTGANLIDTAGNDTHIVATANPSPGQWHHLAVTYDYASGYGKVFVDGVVKSTILLGKFTPATASDVYIGSRPSQPFDRFCGLLDDIRIYDEALSDGEIASLSLSTTNGEPVVGALTCTIIPAIAVAAGAQWRVTSGPSTGWNNSGATLSELPAGSYTVEFQDVENWSAPTARVVNVVLGETTRIEAAYEYAASYSNTMVLHYDFDTYDGVKVTDLSGYGNDGIVSGATFTVTDCGGVYHFDGIDDFITIPASESLNIAGSLSMAAWFKVYDYSHERPLVEWSGTNGAGVHMWTGVPSWHCGANVIDTGNHSHVIATANPSLNVWHHLVVTYDAVSGRACVYVDGDLKNSASLGSFVPKTDVGMFLGNRPSQPDDRLYGLLDEIRIYRGALSTGEVRDIFLQHTNCMVTDASISCSIEPQGARSAGAQWRLTSGADLNWKNSGDHILNLTAGNYTVTFKGITGWESPSDQSVYVPAGGSITSTGVYTTVVSTTNELVLHYSFNTDDGAIVYDQSAYGNNGAVSGATYVASDCGGYYSFDGQNDHILVPASSSLNIADSLTLAAWINVDNYQDELPIVEWVGKGDGVGVHLWTGVWGWQWAGNGTGANLIDVTHNTSSRVISTANPPVREWHHLAVTYDRSIGTARVYLDGVVAGEKQFGVFTPATDGDLIIGYRESQDDAFQGYLDDIRIYKGALSASQILAVFNDDSGCEPPMGSLSCSILPPEAVAAGARWRLVSGAATNWNESGVALVNLAEGSNTVAFKPLSGWTSPADQGVTVVRGSMVQVTGIYSVVLSDAVPPVIVSVQPPDGYVTTSNEFLMTITATDNVAIAQVRVDGHEAISVGGDVYEFETTGIRKSYNSRAIFVSDTAGNAATQTVNYAQSSVMRLNCMWEGYWRVRNPFPYAVDYTWEVVNTNSGESGSGTAPANRDSYFTSSPGHKVIRLLVGGEQVDVCNSNPMKPDPQGLRTGDLDSDGDGFSNREEELVGTSVDDADSILYVATDRGITPLFPSLMEKNADKTGSDMGAEIVLTWTSSVDSVYSVAASVDMTNWYFVPEFHWVAGTDALLSYTNTLTDVERVFLRISAQKRP